MMVGPDWYCMIVTYTFIVVPTFFFLWDVGTVVNIAIIIIGVVTGFTTIV